MTDYDEYLAEQGREAEQDERSNELALQADLKNDELKLEKGKNNES